MINYKLLCYLFFFFYSYTCFSQTASIATDSIQLKLTVFSTDGKPVKTKISFENLSNHKIRTCNTNTNGNTDCMVLTGYSYKIYIPVSDDSYKYEIPEFSISPLPVRFTFSLRPVNK